MLCAQIGPGFTINVWVYLVRVDDEVGLHVLLLHFASLHQISHLRGVPATALPQHRVQRAQQRTDVVLHSCQLSACRTNVELLCTTCHEGRIYASSGWREGFGCSY